MSDAAGVYLVRHGETPGNALRIFQVPETPLSDRGCRQAAHLGARMSGLEVGCIMSSDYRRAAMTAEAIAASTGAALEIEPLLRERNFGDLRGTAYSELDCDPFAEDYLPPAGESWSVFRARVGCAWQAVEARALGCRPGRLVVVTHGLVCDEIVRGHTLPAIDSATPLRFGNTSLTILSGPAPWQVESLACVEHLDAATQHDSSGISGL